MDESLSHCSGCGLTAPRNLVARYEGYFNASPECWSVFTEVLATEYVNAVVFGQVHQHTVDAYAVQHAGGPHPDKSVDVHLAGLHLAFVLGHDAARIPPLLQRLASAVTAWPHLRPPARRGSITVGDVARAGSHDAHIRVVRAWANEVWEVWAEHHEAVAELVTQILGHQRSGQSTDARRGRAGGSSGRRRAGP